jgi:(1->4)-alpha-D-glucan 1-alpha-D-glucosylmutase
MGFDEAAGLAPYLRDLGASHLYCSPVLQAARGSTHGYDVVDHARLRDELGGPAAWRRMCATLDAHGLGVLLDVVPNHMAIAGRDNPWWWDVLENGPASRWAGYFDVDWDPPERRLRQTVLVPILGDHYGRVLEAGELRLARDGAAFVIRYHAHEVPVSPRSLDGLLTAAAARAGSPELESLASAFARLPHATATDRASVQERHRDKEVLRAQLARLCADAPAIAAAIDGEVERVNADPDSLDDLLGRQNYRLAYWRTAGQELDYRRFFDVSTLVALRVEDPQVFDDTHRLVFDLVRSGCVDGLRIDHPDGLRDPEGYLVRLRHECPEARVVVEKILAPDEALPASWPVAGTTGYDFLNVVLGLFVDPAGEAPLTELHGRFTGDTEAFDAAAYRSRHDVMRTVLAADLERLTATFVDVCAAHRRYRDYTRRELRDALRETIAALDVYRTYVQATAGRVGDEDVRRIGNAVEAAGRRRPDLDAALLAFLGDVLLLRHRGDAEAELTMRFQQVSAAVMAKGVEDTAFYRWGPLVALNEVGGDPARFGTSVEAFHRRNAEAARRGAGSLLATSTHDTKRGEDTRLRITLLSEIPERWAAAVWRWAEMNERHRRGGMPDRALEYLLYQTVVGAFPLSVERAVAYVEKATREAKRHTSWIDPNPAYDAAARGFVEGVLGDSAFAADLEAFVRPLVAAGRDASLAQTLLKLTAPGVPDLYQGSELWDLALVDPDNRRPVDWALRRRLLDAVGEAAPEDVLPREDEGSPKLWLVARVLGFRRERPGPFGPDAGYTPLATAGAHAGRAVAYLRADEVAVVVPRLVLGRGDDWLDTTVEVPAGRWRDVLARTEVAGGTIRLAELLARCPVALLARD